MIKRFTEEQKKAARKADLYDFLCKNHMSDFKIEGSSIRLRNNNSVSIKKGYSGYMDFSDNSHGNGIEFLTKYMNYSIVEAVIALSGNNPLSIDNSISMSESHINTITSSNEFILPKPIKGIYKQLFMYLTKSRGISKETIQMLIDMKIIYQYSIPYNDKIINNIIFVNKERDFAEVHGTSTYKSFHGIIPNSRKDGFWWFQPHPEQKTKVVYICEAAIDAISLYEIHKEQGKTNGSVYVSIAGCGKQQTIERLKKSPKVILAVDNDDAGQKCRDRNSDLEYIIPNNKDWNEDLMAKK